MPDGNADNAGGGDYKDKGAAFFDAVHNRFGPLGSGFDITRSDPAFDSLGLELMANRVCYRLVLGGMADKDLRLHGISCSISVWSI